MTVDELHQTFASVADRFRTELRELQAALAEVVARTDAEREAAVQEAAGRARTEAETRAHAQHEAALAEADTRARAQLDAALADADARSRVAADEAQARAKAEQEAAIGEAVARARSDANVLAAAHLQTAVQEAEARARAAAREERPKGWRPGMSTEDTVPVPIPAWQGEERRANPVVSQGPIEAVRALDRAPSLTQILEALLDAASREVARVGLLLRSGDELHGWRFIGFGPICEPASSVVVLPESAGILHDAVRTGSAVLADAMTDGAPWFARAATGSRLAMPVLLAGEVVAVLYADGGDQVQSERPEMTPACAVILELLVRHAARCLEAVTAVRAFGLVAHGQATASSRASHRQRDPAHAASTDEEAARRYARLLVSEIKLYHETAVVTGRRERDLSTRLGGEIARARALYEQRIPRETRGPLDCFYDELVRTLADGDASLLERTTSRPV